MEKQPFQFLQ